MKILKILLLLIFLLGVIYLFLPKYTQRALIYFSPNIDDYKIFENRTVAASNPQAWDFADEYNKYELGDAYQQVLDRHETTAFLIIKDNALLFEKYYLDYSEEDISNSFSAAKSIVSLLVGIAIEEGKIESVFQPVADFLPSFQEGDKNRILIRDVLTMSSGLEWDEAYGGPFSNMSQAYYGKDLKELVGQLEMEKEPGQDFAYKSINTQVLAEVLEAATGQSVSDYASNRLWRKIGAESDALWSLDRSGGMEKAFCCFNSIPRDLARIGQLVLNNGSWNGKQVVDSDYVEVATSPANYIRTNEIAEDYGYHWWILNYNGKQIPYARGILGQYIFVLHDKNAIVVRMGKKRDENFKGEHPEDAFSYVEAAYALLK